MGIEETGGGTERIPESSQPIQKKEDTFRLTQEEFQEALGRINQAVNKNPVLPSKKSTFISRITNIKIKPKITQWTAKIRRAFTRPSKKAPQEVRQSVELLKQQGPSPEAIAAQKRKPLPLLPHTTRAKPPKRPPVPAPEKTEKWQQAKRPTTPSPSPLLGDHKIRNLSQETPIISKEPTDIQPADIQKEANRFIDKFVKKDLLQNDELLKELADNGPAMKELLKSAKETKTEIPKELIHLNTIAANLKDTRHQLNHLTGQIDGIIKGTSRISEPLKQIGDDPTKKQEVTKKKRKKGTTDFTSNAKEKRIKLFDSFKSSFEVVDTLFRSVNKELKDITQQEDEDVSLAEKYNQIGKKLLDFSEESTSPLVTTTKNLFFQKDLKKIEKRIKPYIENKEIILTNKETGETEPMNPNEAVHYSFQQQTAVTATKLNLLLRDNLKPLETINEAAGELKISPLEIKHLEAAHTATSNLADSVNELTRLIEYLHNPPTDSYTTVMKDPKIPQETKSELETAFKYLTGIVTEHETSIDKPANIERDFQILKKFQKLLINSTRQQAKIWSEERPKKYNSILDKQKHDLDTKQTLMKSHEDLQDTAKALDQTPNDPDLIEKLITQHTQFVQMLESLS